jgi:hypothetical protein
MLAGRRALLVGLFVLLNCSTEDIGLHEHDGSTAAMQGMEDPPRPDVGVSRPDRGVEVAAAADAGADAPAPALDATAAPDRMADLPPTDLPNGARCGSRGECKSGFCVDGVCCNEACDDGCSSCTAGETDRADGICGKARAREGKACGRACGTAAGVPAVLERICVSGACVLPLIPKALERCQDESPCVTSFCDDNEGRCVKRTCPTAGTCCCKLPTGTRMCTRQELCRGERMCEP